MNHAVMLHMLRRLGWEAEAASSGVEALLAAERGGFAAVLMDCQMPGMDGYEATRRIRGIEGARGRVPIISVSASAMEEDRLKAIAAGMTAALAKPVRLEALRETLDRLAAVVSSPG